MAPEGRARQALFRVFFDLGPEGLLKAAQGGPKGSSEGSKGVPSEPKVGPGGCQRVPKGSRGEQNYDENGAEMDSLRTPCKEQATARKTAAKPFENSRKLGKLKGKPKENLG